MTRSATGSGRASGSSVAGTGRGARSQTLYELLGLSASATSAQVRSAHRGLVRRLHPDVNKAPDAHEAFTRVQRAYEVLIDEPKRRAYDRLLAQQSAPAVEVVLSPHYSWTSVGGVGGVGGAGGAAPAGASGTSVGVDGDVSRAAYADIERQELGEDVDRYWSVLFEPRARARGDRSDPPGDGPRRSNPP